MSLGVLVTTILWTFAAIMSSVAANNALAISITADAAILQKREEIQEIVKAASRGDGPALAIIRHFSTLATIGDATGDNAISVGPAGELVAKVRWDEGGDGARGLVYTFAVPAPAESLNANTPYTQGYGEVIIYLNESAVPVDRETNALWSDLGKYAADTSKDGIGYDIDGNGKIENNLSNTAKNALERKDVREFKQTVEPYRVPIDITVRYFRKTMNSQTHFETTRRMIVTGLGTMESADLSFK